jgi:hypothetical protein
MALSPSSHLRFRGLIDPGVNPPHTADGWPTVIVTDRGRKIYFKTSPDSSSLGRFVAPELCSPAMITIQLFVNGEGVHDSELPTVPQIGDTITIRDRADSPFKAIEVVWDDHSESTIVRVYLEPIA